MRLKSYLDKFLLKNPALLEIEISEMTALQDIDRTSTILEEFARLGIHFSIDNFGTGNTTLTCLQKISASLLKIDSTFIAGMTSNTNSLNIVESIISLATSFEKKVIAGGVEHIDHCIYLLTQGCRYAQGNLIAKPMSAQRLLAWIKIEKIHEKIILWKGYSYNPHFISWLHALTKHTEWLNTFSAYTLGKTTIPPEESPEICLFGTWLQNEIKSSPKDKKWFLIIQKLHNRIHSIAGRVTKSYLNESSPLSSHYHTIEILSEKLKQLIYIKILIESRQYQRLNDEFLFDKE